MSLCVDSLQENALGDSGVISLASALKTNSSLTVLWWVSCDFSLGFYLKKLQASDSDCVCVCSLQGVSAGKAGAVALAGALVVNESLHTLE